jgi:hypothetical protein
LGELEEEKVVDHEGIRQPRGGGKSAFETIAFLLRRGVFGSVGAAHSGFTDG